MKFSPNNIVSPLACLSFVLCLICATLHIHAFGARRQYHSYHHISQKKRHTRRSDRHISGSRQNKYSSSSNTSISSAASNSHGTNVSENRILSSTLIDETELLLQRAAHIRELNARRREVLLTPSSNLAGQYS